mmetsp:Transcript_10690/g.20715  ORF Transcript_10690/g.20715 Transcript_10690/m.20715 type:complete len:130 (+) Transcript_10690:3-392(+)
MSGAGLGLKAAQNRQLPSETLYPNMVQDTGTNVNGNGNGSKPSQDMIATMTGGVIPVPRPVHYFNDSHAYAGYTEAAAGSPSPQSATNEVQLASLPAAVAVGGSPGPVEREEARQGSQPPFQVPPRERR